MEDVTRAEREKTEEITTEDLDKQFKIRWLKELKRPGINRVMDMPQTARRRRFRIMATCLDAEFRDVEKKWKEERDRTASLQKENYELKRKMDDLQWEINALKNGQVNIFPFPPIIETTRLANFGQKEKIQTETFVQGCQDLQIFNVHKRS